MGKCLKQTGYFGADIFHAALAVLSGAAKVERGMVVWYLNAWTAIPEPSRSAVIAKGRIPMVV